VCIELAGTHCGEPAEDADDDFFSIAKIMFLHPLLPERNDHGYELRRRRHERGIFLRPTIPNAILYRQLHKYRPIGTDFSTSQLSTV